MYIFSTEVSTFSRNLMKIARITLPRTRKGKATYARLRALLYKEHYWRYFGVAPSETTALDEMIHYGCEGYALVHGLCCCCTPLSVMEGDPSSLYSGAGDDFVTGWHYLTVSERSQDELQFAESVLRLLIYNVEAYLMMVLSPLHQGEDLVRTVRD